MKKIEVDLPTQPPAGGFACCPSGDNDYDEALKRWNHDVNQKILESIPNGFYLKSCTVKEIKVVKNVAEITLEKLC